MNQPKAPKTISNIDLLRGITAIAVLVWHYQHFLFPRAGIPPTDRTSQPFYQPLRWLYDYGGNGVQFFWILSGFVFFHAYKYKYNINSKEFFINRFSRLYPLHFITLILVAGLQAVSNITLGYEQIYPKNDAYHFILNVLFASHWGFQKGWSFNAPIWSVSVELITYIFFFFFLRSLKISLGSAIFWVASSAIVFQGPYTNSFAQCTILFGLGGVTHELHSSIYSKFSEWINFAIAFIITTGLVTYLFAKGTWQPNILIFLLFPCIIWISASIETCGYSSGKVGEMVGNTTYASYLIHIPIQIAIMTSADILHIDRFKLVKEPIFFIFFIIFIFTLSHWVFKYIESPLKHRTKILLNSNFLSRRLKFL